MLLLDERLLLLQLLLLRLVPLRLPPLVGLLLVLPASLGERLLLREVSRLLVLLRALRPR